VGLDHLEQFLYRQAQFFRQLFRTRIATAELTSSLTLRGPSPGLRMHCQFVPVTPWLRQVLLSGPPHERNVKTVRRDELQSMWMEPRLMELALSNLLANALRYARSNVSIEVAHEGGSYRLVVEDDGEGIPEAQRASVFNAFTRLDTSRNRDTGGFGLGLAIVARIAALHRGRVTAGASATLGGARLVLEWPEP